MRRDQHEPVGFVDRLADGLRVLYRPIQPDDKQRIIDGIARLSPRSRYLRFFSPLSRPSHDMLKVWTEVDQHRHLAWCAVEGDDPAQPGVGIARLVRQDHDATAAELAIAVVDDHQHQGVGSTLLTILALKADRVGIRTIVAYMLAQNEAALRWFRHLGAGVTFKGDCYEGRVSVSDLLQPSASAGPAMQRFANLAHLVRARLA
ncbi:MAG: GNAT family N-acetyltransferase [Phycisphaeraceae bacterium]|nr:GNAT family N-acetyltransferase [Phycisphaeraceae bacterium]